MWKLDTVGAVQIVLWAAEDFQPIAFVILSVFQWAIAVLTLQIQDVVVCCIGTIDGGSTDHIYTSLS